MALLPTAHHHLHRPVVGLERGVNHLGMGEAHLLRALPEDGDVVDGRPGRVGGVGVRFRRGEDVKGFLHLRQEGGVGRVVPVAREEDGLLIALQGADEDADGGQTVFLGEREVCAGIDVVRKFDYEQRAPLFFAGQGMALHADGLLRAEHADAVSATAVVDGGGIDGGHAGQPAKLLHHIKAIAALRDAVHFLNGDDVRIQPPDDLGDAFEGNGVVHALAVTDVITGQRPFGGSGFLSLSATGREKE